MTDDDKYKSVFLRKGAEQVLKNRPTELQRLTGILEFLGVFHNSANQALWVNMPAGAPGPRVLPPRSPLVRAFLRPVSDLG